jgi:isoleucyl-tRNA synthetase
MFAPLPEQVQLPRLRSPDPELVGRARDLRAKSLRAAGRRPSGSCSTRARRPPTGLPHPGHCLTRAMKDLFPRYQTMCGKLRRAQGRLGHARPAGRGRGLQRAGHPHQGGDRSPRRREVRPPVHSRACSLCDTREWEEPDRAAGLLGQPGRGVRDLPPKSYVESVWWGLKTLFERGLLYQGHKVVWWWAQGGTALSEWRGRRGLPHGCRTQVCLREVSACLTKRRDYGAHVLPAVDLAQVTVHMDPIQAALACWSGPPRHGR